MSYLYNHNSKDDDDQLLLSSYSDSFNQLSKQIDNFDNPKHLRVKPNTFEYAKLNGNNDNSQIVISDEKMAAARNKQQQLVLSEITNQQNIQSQSQNSPKFAKQPLSISTNRQIGTNDQENIIAQENVSQSFLKIKEISETIQSSIQNLNNLLAKAKTSIGNTTVSQPQQQTTLPNNAPNNNYLNEYFSKLIQSSNANNNNISQSQQPYAYNQYQPQQLQQQNDIFRTKSCTKFFDDDNFALAKKNSKPQSVSFKSIKPTQQQEYLNEEEGEDGAIDYFPINPHLENINNNDQIQNENTTNNPFCYQNLFQVDKNSKKISKLNNGTNLIKNSMNNNAKSLTSQNQSKLSNNSASQNYLQQQKNAPQQRIIGGRSQIKNYHLYQNNNQSQVKSALSGQQSQQQYKPQQQQTVKSQSQSQQTSSFAAQNKNKMSVNKFQTSSLSSQQQQQQIRGKLSVNKFVQSQSQTQNPKASQRKAFFY